MTREGRQCQLRNEGRRRTGPQSDSERQRRRRSLGGVSMLALSAASATSRRRSRGRERHRRPKPAPQGGKPNIVVIMGDDIGIWNIGAYHRGMMAGRTPNLDKLAAEGMLFTDYYAEASCTAGRANFITGELPIRTGMTTVGQAGSPDRHARAGGDHRHGAQVHGLCHRPVRQEPPRRSQRVPADRPRLRRVLRLPLSPRRDGRPRAPRLPAGAAGQGRPAQHGPQLGDRHGRPDGDAALGQGRQAEDRGRRHALSQADGDRGRRNPRPLLQVHRQGQGRRQAVLPLAQPDAHAHRHPPLGQVRGDAQLEEWLDHSRSRHGPARRHRRRRDEEAQGHGRGRQHHRRVHHRQRHRRLHLARWRTDAVRAEQRDGHGRRLPRAGHDSLARQGSRRQGRERHHLRPRLVPDLRRRRRQSEHRRGTARRARSSATRPTRSISTATTRWT